MQIIIIFIVFYLVTCFVSNQNTKEPLNDVQQKIVSKTTAPDCTTNAMDSNKNLNYLWIRRSDSDNLQTIDEFVPYKSVFKAPYFVTRLAKTLSSGFDPYFYKGHFEPFERRPKPVTLLAIRKNGILPRSSMPAIDSRPMETAELQSPYNDVGSFWQGERAT